MFSHVRNSLLLIILVSQLMIAQTFTGSISGTVTDDSGAVMPSVQVAIINAGTGVRTTVQTDASGNFQGLQLPPGSYRVEVEVSGFKRFVQEGIILQVQQHARIDVTLSIGSVSESVLVTADASMLEASDAQVGRVVDNRRIRELPLNTRNVYSLIFLTPGVAGSVGDNYGGTGYSINGARTRMNETVIDGMPATHPSANGDSGIAIFPSVDAIEEFKVMAGNSPAEFGRSLGSVINIIYKSGTNDLHGSAYEFLRNSVMDANNFFANRNGQDLTSFKRSQFGGTVSGPIVRNRTFFMGSFEGLRQRSFANNTSTVPTQLQRQGDFSQTFAPNGNLVTIFDPLSTTRTESGGYVRTPFAGNVINPGRFDPVAVNVIRYYPNPNIPGNAITNENNFFASGSALSNMDNIDGKLDHNITETQTIFGRYSYRYNESAPPAYFPQEIRVAEGRIVQQNDSHNAVVNYTNTLNPTSILNINTGFSRTFFVYNNQGLGFLPSSLGLPASIDSAVDQQMFPAFGAAGYQSLGGGDHRRSAFMSYNLIGSLTKILGNHTVKFGYEGRMYRANIWEARSAGTFNFSRGFTQGPNPNAASASAGNSIASLLLGTGTEGNALIQNWKNVAAQSFYHAMYIQDDWRVTQKLTLNLGLRYDLDVPRTERYNRQNYFDPDAPSPLASVVPGFPDLRGGLVFAGVNGNSRYQYAVDKNNFAPRIGLAYQVDPKTVVRMGFATIFGISNQSAHGTVGPFGFRTENPWVSTLDGGLTPYNYLRDPYPDGFRPSPGAAEGLLTQVGANIQAPLHNTVTSHSLQYNFTIQRELPSQMLLNIGYVGTRGLQLEVNHEGGLGLNQLDPRYMALGSQLNDLVDNPFFGHVTTGVLAAPRVSRAQLLRPYPQFTEIIPLYMNGASSTYHSMQATLSKRLTHGLQFEGSYTWSKCMENPRAMTQNSYDFASTRSVCSLDIPHRFVIGYIYELPLGNGRAFLTNATGVTNWLLGGWQLNGITTFQSGSPLNFSANNTAGIFNPSTFANNNGKSGKLDGPVHDRLNRYFDTSVFSQPAPFTFGNMSPYTAQLRGDIMRNFDLSMFKEFKPTEKFRVQFRAEFLNAFNTPRFGLPNRTVTSGSFGVVTSQANTPRQTQLGLKLIW
jgi:hypothetical protein